MTIQVVEWMQSFQNGFFDFFFNFISFLGEEYVYIVVLSIIYFAYDKTLGEFMGFTLFITGAVNNILKGVIKAERPFQKYPDRVTNLRPQTSGGYSFPSGHTQNFSTFTFDLAFWHKKRWIFYVALLFSIFMALSRMYLGVHFLEDVGVGLLLGVLISYFGYKVFIKIKDNTKTLFTVYVGILIVLLPIMILVNYEDLYKTYGLMLGFTAGMYVEKRYVNFKVDVVLWKRALRVVVGLFIMIAIQAGLGALFDTFASEGSMLLHILDLVRYGLISFIGLGCYPALFKKLNF